MEEVLLFAAAAEARGNRRNALIGISPREVRKKKYRQLKKKKKKKEVRFFAVSSKIKKTKCT